MSPDPHWKAAEEALQEAASLVTGDRNASYGEPEDDFSHIAQLWTACLGNKLKADAVVDEVDVGYMMVQLKIARDLFQQPKRDSIVDAIGYLACLGRIRHKRGDWD